MRWLDLNGCSIQNCRESNLHHLDLTFVNSSRATTAGRPKQDDLQIILGE
uniref:Uncharacterized protein n=1 Tax=Arundo donax TaxID=35708 RepID=A0A0A9D1V6_ARUDO